MWYEYCYTKLTNPNSNALCNVTNNIMNYGFLESNLKWQLPGSCSLEAIANEAI